jgi:outer membrane protein OmpA-like peptidoglycan-associated protein
MGAQGMMGRTGTQGTTLVGPVGTTGAQGAVGTQGIGGQTGGQGSTMAGSVGAAGSAGPAGVQGTTGATGAQGPVGIVARWTSYRVINFAYNSSDLSSSDQRTIADAATYLAKNPSLQVGLDGYRDPRNPYMSNRRIGAVRDALIAAGVPYDKVQVGAFGDPEASREQRVEMLLRTGPAEQKTSSSQ